MAHLIQSFARNEQLNNCEFMDDQICPFSSFFSFQTVVSSAKGLSTQLTVISTDDFI
jgi:hypothetical protein